MKIKVINTAALNLNVQKKAKVMPCDYSVFAKWTYTF